MSQTLIASSTLFDTPRPVDGTHGAAGGIEQAPDDAALAARLTREASTQTYQTIRLLVDRSLVNHAYRAYAYFRWVDDVIDQHDLAQAERVAFVKRQQSIIRHCYHGDFPQTLLPEERLVAQLIHCDRELSSGLHDYISQMMAVMAFDAGRQGRTITQAELDIYTLRLAVAVTEALHYFIGHGCASPLTEARYQAVSAAHITHMLRDAIEDAADGYYNVPRDFLDANRLSPFDFDSVAYCAWVEERTRMARRLFANGRKNLALVENLRCRLAGHAYIGRFEVVLDAIERDRFTLRAEYPERKSGLAAFKIGWKALTGTAFSTMPTSISSVQASAGVGGIA